MVTEMEKMAKALEEANEKIAESILSSSSGHVKYAEDALGDYTRTKLREESFFRKWMPVVKVTNDELDRSVDYHDPIMIFDYEPDSGAAISVGYDTLPDNIYIRGRRWALTFGRIETPKATIDVGRLRTWKADLRKIVSDNMVKDMGAEEDGKWLRAVNRALVGAMQVVPYSGVIQYQTMSGGITRQTLSEALAIIPSCPASFATKNMLLNHITMKEFTKTGMDETGGSMSQDIYMKGWTSEEILGKTMMATIKKGLVPTNTIYFSAEADLVGKARSLEDPTLYVRREAFFVEFFAYEELGSGIANTSTLARVDFE